MVTISHAVKKLADEIPFLHEAIAKGIVNYANLAEVYKKRIDSMLGFSAKETAIVMAFRRYADKIKSREKNTPRFDYESEITMKTGLADIAIVKSPAFFSRLKEAYSAIDYNKGDVLNIIHGNNEAIIVTNERNRKKILSIFKDEKIISIEEGLVAFSLKFNPDFLYTSGVIYSVVKEFAWEDINILELVTTNTEMTLLVKKKDVNRAYNVLEGMLQKK